MATKFIIVWGMHRSGTSLIARALQVFGADLGQNLFAGNPGNPRGYFEDKGLMQLDGAMLKELGMSWDSLTPVTEKHVRHLVNAGYQEFAADFLREVGKRGPVVALKDPRMTRLAPFWRRVFHEAGIVPVSIVAFRQVGAVISSLASRARMSLRPGLAGCHSYAAYLWLGYTLASLLYTSGFPRVLVQYEKFLDRPREILAGIGEKLGLSMDERELQSFCEDFVDKELNHASGKMDEVNALPKRVLELEQVLASLPELSFPPAALVGRMWPGSETEIDLCQFIDQSMEALRDNWRGQMERRQSDESC